MYRVRLGADGAFEFLLPNGRPIEDTPSLPPVSDDALTALIESLVDAGVDLEEMPGYPGWDGSALDLGWAVDGLRSIGA